MKSKRLPLAVIFLPSATKLRRLCFYTCLSVHKGRGLTQCMLGCHTPRNQAPPQDQALPPRPDTFPDQAPPWDQVPPQDQAPPPGPDPPEQTATAADGTHPPGMHSCSCPIL